ncbi:hypothetical protein N8786_04320 [Candidatus Pelagibacter ubique]|nr:hypothetical protein [Candidatus Pelagibacter ubique]
MKKILISITNGFSLRYICHTDILKTFLENNFQVSIISNNASSTKKNIGINEINYLEFSEKKTNLYKFSSRFYNILENIRMFTYGGKYNTPELVFNISYKNRNIKFYLYKIIKYFLNKSIFLRKFLLYIQSFFYPDELFKIIKSNNPDIILTTSLGTFSFDEYILRISKKLNILSSTVMLSWDNPTTRGYPGALPNNIFSWTSIMKKELIEFSDCNKKNIEVAGIPHFDNYFLLKNIISKKNFHENFNIPIDKKIILLITKAPSTFQYNPNICKIISENILNKKLKNCHLITRVHPLFYKINKDNGHIEFSEGLKVFEKLNNDYDCLTVNFPNITSLKQDFEMHKNEQNFVKNLIFHSDVLVNIYSTFNIEGAIFDKPLINIDFDDLKPMYEWNKKFERQSIAIDRNLDHNQRIVKSKGIRNVKNESELIQAIDAYIKNPKLDSSKRSTIVENEAGPNKGSAGIFIGKKIISLL